MECTVLCMLAKNCTMRPRRKPWMLLISTRLPQLMSLIHDSSSSSIGS